MSTILFELGCEELPPKSLKTLRDALQTNVQNGLVDADINVESVVSFAAPRRLALLLTNIDEKQPDSVEEKRGPAVQAAFDADGNPTRAAQGFAAGAGMTVDQLDRLKTDKGEWLLFKKEVKGKATAELLPEIIQKALDNLPIAKRMRSGNERSEFVRPVQWVVLMSDSDVIPATIQGFESGNVTYGHRFHAPAAATIAHANDYESVLESAKVVASFEKRQAQIVEQVNALAGEVNAQPIMPQDLLDEVTALVELPVALRANFEERFLAVPQEALIYTMQADQKYFCLTNAEGKLQPYFITVSNIESKDPQQIISGNEKVVRPRLADAEFFFEQDQKQPLADLAPKLEKVVFQEKLGTVWQKSQRVALLASSVASTLTAANVAGANAEHAHKAALLAKCDLVSNLVYEFPDMQGIAGKYYAELNGEPSDVASAILEQYLPKGAGDELPQTATGLCVALADKLDTLVGIFGIGMLPSGSKDPFSLRRAAIGILRILIEKKLDVSLLALIDTALESYASVNEGVIADAQKTKQQVLEFVNSRYRAMYQDQGVAVDVIQAVQAVNPEKPVDFDSRIFAVQAFTQLPQAEQLAAANKRVANILAKADKVTTVVNESLLVEAAEKELFAQVQQVIATNAAENNYQNALANLAQLQQPLDAFFDDVMVNAEDEAVRANRLALLATIRTEVTTVADISLLQG